MWTMRHFSFQVVTVKTIKFSKKKFQTNCTISGRLRLHIFWRNNGRKDRSEHLPENLVTKRREKKKKNTVVKPTNILHSVKGSEKTTKIERNRSGPRPTQTGRGGGGAKYLTRSPTTDKNMNYILYVHTLSPTYYYITFVRSGKTHVDATAPINTSAGRVCKLLRRFPLSRALRLNKLSFFVSFFSPFSLFPPSLFAGGPENVAPFCLPFSCQLGCALPYTYSVYMQVLLRRAAGEKWLRQNGMIYDAREYCSGGGNEVREKCVGGRGRGKRVKKQT